MGDAGDWKALYAAAARGDAETCALAVGCGADPNHQHPEFGTTPLIAATEAGHLDVVRALLAAGADPRIRANWDGYDAIEVARSKGLHVILAELTAAAEPG
jgi:ankyrin repeat protein